MLAARTPDGKYAKRLALAAILALHAVAIAVLVSDVPVRPARADAAPIVVTLIPSPPILQPTDEAAVETVKRWRFLPARQGDHAVAAWVLVPIAFVLSS